MKRERYTYHAGQAIDITEDTRPTCWEAGYPAPFRVVQDSWSELLIFVYRTLGNAHLCSSMSNPHVNFAILLMKLLEMHFKLHGISPYLNVKEAPKNATDET